jgi:hypothetical protein
LDTFDPPPTLLVEDGRQHLGRWRAPPTRANLIEARYRGWPRPFRRWRLKEWEAFQIASPRVFVNVALFDAKLMSLLQVKVYDRARATKHVFEKKLRPGAFRIADQLHDSSARYPGLAFDNHFARGEIAIDVDVPIARGRVVVHTDRGASQVVSLPFAGDVGMYSHKGMFPADGELTIEGERVALDGALALMDDHKGYYPYVMRWDWVTSATRGADGRARGFNLTANQCRDPDTFNENCAWLDERVGRLPAVTFERVHAREPGERWRVRDRDGRVDVTFEPTVPGDVKVNALVVESRYRGPFGTFTGRLEPEGLEPIVVDGWFGMGEDFWLRC